jgi:methylated-DNA-[protein]-cysteine S-methyltransferase
MIDYRLMPSPLGDILLRAEDDCLSGLFFVGQKYCPALPSPPARAGAGAPPVMRRACEEIAAFFAGEKRAFEVPLKLAGSAFQQRVWQALAAIPYGTVVSYGTLAARLGFGPAHARAVGSAAGRNPVSIIIPCHRVLGGTGELTGYAGGLHRKQALLALENPRLAAQRSLLD